ncbi:MAG: DUF4290 domain-containing protein [Flavobacteriales bacterium]|nr:DUF4290 domain-containing protein [Flavobacteriales bacterium]
MKDFDMTYNTEKELLVIAEYGRNIQRLINHAKTIEDSKERQEYAEAIVNLMNQMVPQANKEVDEHNEKLWRHLFRIANHELDVVAPSGIQYTREQASMRPDRVNYPHQNVRFRHYGSNIHRLIEKALAMEDEEKQMGFAYVIGSYMKLAYKTWNREHYVSDDIIKEDLETLSNGKLVLEDEMSFKTPNFSNNRGRSGRGRDNRGRGRDRNSGRGGRRDHRGGRGRDNRGRRR